MIFTAVKCNDDQTVLEIMAALGTGFDCASKVTAYVFIIIILLRNHLHQYENNIVLVWYIKFLARNSVHELIYHV